MSFFISLRLAYAVCLVLTCHIAFQRGGRPERTGAMIILIGSVLTWVIEQEGLFDWRDARAGLVLVDLSILLAFLALALRTDRFWPLWVTAFHLIAVTTHFVMFLVPSQLLRAYAFAQGFWAYPMLLTIGLASIPHAEPRPRPRR